MTVNLDILNQESDIVPMLVKLYDSQKICDLAKDKEPDARQELTSIVTSLLEMELSAREAELVADVLISLMRQAEKDLCLALSEKLSVMDAVPLRLALHIASESIDIAEPMLKNSQVFNDLDLIYIIKSKTPDYWQAIAKREKLGESVVNTLADTTDLDTAIALAENKNIALTDHAVSVLVAMAQGEDRLASPLIRRDDITDDIVKTLYQTVGIALKDYIRREFDVNDTPVIDAVDNTIAESLAAANASMSLKDKSEVQNLPRESHIKIAQNYEARGVLTLQMTLETLKRGQYQAFVAQFATYMKLTPKAVNEVLLQESGQGLAIICKAEAIQRNDFVSIYLLASRLRNKGGMVDSKNLGRATHYYDGINHQIARDIVSNAQKNQLSIVKI